MQLDEAELEFLCSYAIRKGQVISTPQYRIRVPLGTKDYKLAIKLMEKGLLSRPRPSGSVALRNFYLLSAGVAQVRDYWRMLHRDAERPKPVPTAAAPGSREKIEELRRRATAGEELWHEADSAPRCREAERVWRTFI